MSESEDFENVVKGQYGQMEAVMGQGMYDANLKMAQTNIASVEKDIEAKDCQIKDMASYTEARVSLLRAFSFMLIMMTIPFVVWMWRWALGFV